MATDDRSGPDPADMERIAGAILNGEDVDWPTVRASTASPGALLAQLRTLSEVCDFYRQLPAGGESISPGTTWGHLRIEQRLGGGAFGDVYRAWDSRLDRLVALKLLHPEAWPDADVAPTIVAEARLLAKVRHENVVTVYGAERINGRIGLWMELVRGRTLVEEVRESGPLSVDAAVDVAIRLCGALDAIHQAA